ncbi:MAG: threonine dehydratase [Rhodobacteraceae bacterium]|nr:threonine dehydratase [Paracoccaceae bacterium]
MFTLDELKEASRTVYRAMQPTPQLAWPLLEEETGCNVWVKHENHTPIGAFKIRGGITFVEWLKTEGLKVAGVVTATRGNHGQSIARAATQAGLKAKIVVPHGNSVEKNRAMKAFGAELIEFGSDFDSAKLEAARIASDEGFEFVPPFHRELVRGVATYGLELMLGAPPLDTIYVPIGCGSGICGLISARDCLGLDTKIVGVVSEHAATAKLSVEAGRLVETNSADTFADGMAVRVPVKAAFDIYSEGADRIVAVSDEQIVEAMLCYLRTTHNLTEGAGAAPLAALMNEKDRQSGKAVGLIMSGGNIDLSWTRQVIAGKVPRLS